MKVLFILALGLAAMSCLGTNNETPPSKPAPPIAVDGQVEFFALQQASTPLPGSDGKVLVTLGDITQGQVMTTVSWANGLDVVSTRSLKENDLVSFTISNHTYRLRLKKLKNLLLGRDSAKFLFWPATADPAAPIVLDSPVAFSIQQRSTIDLPGSDGKVVLSLDDITLGQVMTTLSWSNGSNIVSTRSLREKDVVTFTIAHHTYKIKLVKLNNVLVGEDSANFQLWPVSADSDKSKSETEKIEALIGSLKQLNGASFIRNEQEHTLDDAMKLMREKWEWKKSQIKTADDFIRIAGSQSSTTGKAYILIMSDGTEMQTEKWFRKQLELIEN